MFKSLKNLDVGIHATEYDKRESDKGNQRSMGPQLAVLTTPARRTAFFSGLCKTCSR